MKKTTILISAILAIGAMAPVAAFADAQVQVYPIITNAYGGTRFANDLSTTITYGQELTQDSSGVPTYDLGAGTVDYKVTADSFAGYAATLDAGCAGTAQDGQVTVCTISWTDGAPVASTPAPQPAAAAPSSSLPAAPQSSTIIALPSASVSDEGITDQQAQIAALQQEIIQLLQELVMLLQAKVNAQTV